LVKGGGETLKRSNESAKKVEEKDRLG